MANIQPNTYVRAFFHWISWLIVLGGGAAFLRTGNSEFLLGLVVAEVLWVAAGSRAEFFQRYVAIKNGQKSEVKRELASLAKQQELSYEYKSRFRNLETLRKEILEAIKSNKRLDVEIVKPEIDKIDVLIDAFVRTAVAHKKVTKYLEDNREDALAKERDGVAQQIAKLAPNAEAMVRDNLKAQQDMLDQRIAERARMVTTAQSLGVQLDTIEKTLAFLKTKVTAFESPTQMQAEIQSVVSGLEAAERTLRETDKIEEEVRAMERRMAMRA
jgi:hypothetical protein